jgi:pyridinium-3,5-biscarboxylic acid mononucleotide sulfurtransferase
VQNHSDITTTLPAVDALAEKLGRLRSTLRALESVCLGYSGGVDSAFLAVVSLEVLGPQRMLAVTGRSAAVAEAQLQSARACARQFGVPHIEIATDELADANYAANPENRCYFCKTELWRVLHAEAERRGLASVIDGSNADDAHDYRPGLAATRTRGVRSPLLETGLTKAEIRRASLALGLPTWDQPASPCLASRLPYGLAVTAERLHQVERGEAALRSLGFHEFRVRHHGDAARLEFAPTEMSRAVDFHQQIAAAMHESGFRRVLLDVEGYRRGALNEGLNLVPLVATR